MSIATVSRALNGLQVSTTNRALVERAASDLGYIANDAARSLRRERTMTMGVVVPDLGSTLGVDLLDSLAESIEAAGYSLLISTARGDADRYDLLIKRFLERRADALFCIRPIGGGAFLERYVQESIPVVSVFGGRGRYAELPTIRPALDEAAAEVADQLVGDGHRRVALVGVISGPGPQAVDKALASRGVEVVHVEVVESHGTRSAIAGLMDADRTPTAVVAQDPAVRGVVAACESLDIVVPDDLTIVGICDRVAETWFAQRDVSSMTVDPHRMGRAAGTAMLAWLDGVQPPRRTRVQTGTFVPRGSRSTDRQTRGAP